MRDGICSLFTPEDRLPTVLLSYLRVSFDPPLAFADADTFAAGSGRSAVVDSCGFARAAENETVLVPKSDTSWIRSCCSSRKIDRFCCKID